jgi:hypothetical protein
MVKLLLNPLRVVPLILGSPAAATDGPLASAVQRALEPVQVSLWTNDRG